METIRECIEGGADPHIIGSFLYRLPGEYLQMYIGSALQVAIDNEDSDENSLEILRLLLNQDVKFPNQEIYSLLNVHTPFCCAIQRYKLKCAAELIQYGAEVISCTTNCSTPLYKAFSLDHTNVDIPIEHYHNAFITLINKAALVQSFSLFSLRLIQPDIFTKNEPYYTKTREIAELLLTKLNRNPNIPD